jgi:flagellar basal body-associated protein FliL
MPNLRRIKIIWTSLLVILLVALLAAGYFGYQWWSLKNNPSSASTQEAAAVIRAVGHLIVLPKDEEPTVATVSDPKLLQQQAFFAQAKKGDKVLIYAKAKKVILYDPINKKIVDVAPLNIGDTP